MAYWGENQLFLPASEQHSGLLIEQPTAQPALAGEVEVLCDVLQTILIKLFIFRNPFEIVQSKERVHENTLVFIPTFWKTYT